MNGDSLKEDLSINRAWEERKSKQASEGAGWLDGQLLLAAATIVLSRGIAPVGKQGWEINPPKGRAKARKNTHNRMK